MNTQTFSLAKSVAARFLRGGIAGATAAMLLIITNSPATSLSDVGHFLNSLGAAAVSGFLTGIILGIDKYVRSVGSDAGSAS